MEINIVKGLCKKGAQQFGKLVSDYKNHKMLS